MSTSTATARQVDDLTVMVAGQGGDGSLNLVNLLADLFGRRGLHLYQARNVESRIKGGHAAAFLRASTADRRCLGDHFDLLIAFDAEAVTEGAPYLADDAVVLYDPSHDPFPEVAVPDGATVLELPSGRLAVRELRRELYKNSLAFGLVGHVAGIGSTELEAALRRGLARLPSAVVDANVEAMTQGLAHAEELAPLADGATWEIASGQRGQRMFISGNEALSLGFVAAGGRFFAGYPITPASEILETLTKWLPQFDGVALQAEDELAAVNMALGAAMTGTRAMTATSGPGAALMQEGVAHAGSAEIPVVIVDSQRAGPSTGMPTKPEQSDVGMMVNGASGDFPRVVLAPGDPVDAFELGVLAVNLADRLQGPVYLALDQVVSQDQTDVVPLDLDGVRIDRHRVLTDGELAEAGEYRRYLRTEDGVSPYAVFGVPGGQSLVTGNERDEWGLVTTKPRNREAMVDKRARKLDAVRPHLPSGRTWGDEAAPVGLVGFGMQTGVIAEAAERLADRGHAVRCLQPRTLSPVTDDTTAFVERCERVYVVEHNATGQYRDVLAAATSAGPRLRGVLRYDGVPFRPGELVDRILAREAR
ncbi:2-oxoacid:acceptor oxidoreductase subunit alpha [Egibacter rhizosphaerae]|uniref:2-oxoacid:acceptor oxidoreductase subunit alpha n=1 Tax=Egibacter rhizosphaerae TaxID=1670831 RepID=A0A411YF82_9ACTN|nr:2-oxoacid:acceptor oxidoreductase subunit alpha [Egibacter rhizosphaerae]QBI19924.1 2-oxoacid:acceptor oxidoreductase subunit alpha [Egibacter rhizosphaerae]